MNDKKARFLINALINQANGAVCAPGQQQAILIRQHNDVEGWWVAELREIGAADWHAAGIGVSPETALEDLAFKIELELEG